MKIEELCNYVFPYYKVNFKLLDELNFNAGLNGFPYYKVNFKPLISILPTPISIESFHTIKSILNPSLIFFCI